MARNGRFRQLTVVLLCFGFAGYFGLSAIKGRHGLEARLRLDAQARALQERLSGLETVLSHLKRDVALLQDDHLDVDSLDEAARLVLGYAAEGDVVVLRR
jgi:cell division protein FtsB